jgi:hypothetical protein
MTQPLQFLAQLGILGMHGDVRGDDLAQRHLIPRGIAQDPDDFRRCPTLFGYVARGEQVM